MRTNTRTYYSGFYNKRDSTTLGRRMAVFTRTINQIGK